MRVSFVLSQLKIGMTVVPSGCEDSSKDLMEQLRLLALRREGEYNLGEFSTAVDYVLMVRARFVESPHVYLRFLDLLNEFDDTKDVLKCRQEMAQLFCGHNDLVDRLENFLPS